MIRYAVLWVGCLLISVSEAIEHPAVLYGPAVQLAELANDKIRESSGLAPSRRSAEVFWTHNDQGDQPRLFAFGIDGRHLGTSQVRGAEAEDWEDMVSFTAGGKPYLGMGDLGDNELRRTHCTIYLAEEPANPKNDMQVQRQIDFTYEDGPHDCEALGFDAVRGEFLMIEKRDDPRCRVYLLPWTRANKSAVARSIAVIEAPFVTAMDISPDGLRAIVLTRDDAREFCRASDESWAAAFARPAQSVTMPSRRQGESICYGADGYTLFLTSEKRPVPLFKIAPLTPGVP